MIEYPVPVSVGIIVCTLERIAARSRLENRPAGAPIFTQGAPARSLFIVADGWVKLVRARPERVSVALVMLASGGARGGCAGYSGSSANALSRTFDGLDHVFDELMFELYHARPTKSRHTSNKCLK